MLCVTATLLARHTFVLMQKLLYGQLHTSIYDKRDYFNLHITNFSFLSSNIPSSPTYDVFISELILYARVCSSYECLFWEPGDFPVSYSNRDTSLNVWNRNWGSFMVDTEILFNNMKYPSHECSMTFWPLTRCKNNAHWLFNRSDFPSIFITLIPSLTFTELRVLIMDYLQRVWHVSRKWLPFRTPGSFPWFGNLLMLQLLRQVFPNLPFLFSIFYLEYPSVLSRFCFIPYHWSL